MALAEPVQLPWRAVAQYPHLTDGFTQGLEWDAGTVLESSGLYRRSFISRWQPGGRELDRRRLSRSLFAEGLTLLDDRIYVLTWRAGTALVFDRQLNEVGQYRYDGEGWGLTNNGRELIVSDGSAWLRFFGPTDFSETRRLQVMRAGTPVRNLNELEWVDGRILANVWHSDEVLLIDPTSGEVTAVLNLAALDPGRRCGHCVLNGIAFDPNDGTLLVTGKRWAWVYRIAVDGLR